MYQTIEEYKDIQYQINDNRRWLYNVRNDRMITSNHHLEKYLEAIEEPDNPLHDFYTSPYRRGKWTNFHLIRLILDSSKMVFNTFDVNKQFYLATYCSNSNLC